MKIMTFKLDIVVDLILMIETGVIRYAFKIRTREGHYVTHV